MRRRDEPVLGVVARDVAERLRADQEKAELQAQLTHAQKMQAAGQVAAGIAHDFGNLLAVIRNGVSRLRGLRFADSAGGWTETLDVIERAAQEASSSTRSLLMFTRRVPAERVPLDLCELARDALRIMRHLLPPTIELYVRTCAGATCWISGDPSQLQQVLLNLVLNARDAMSAGGRLEIMVTSSPNGSAAADSGSAPPAEPTVRLSVRDEGVGIPQHLHARIFEPFFTTKAGGYGTGLGLATVQSIIADHGGHIELESEVGRGSTFTVVLPQTLPAAAAGGVRGRGETIMLMEPNRHIRRLVMSTLRSWGYVVVTAPDGAGAYEAYAQSPDAVALLILNADVPEQGALDCVQRVRAAGRRVPILLTVGSLSTDVSCLLADEATVLLHKPFQMAELGRVLSQLLTQRADGAE
jgi:signal transduction histidine kinase